MDPSAPKISPIKVGLSALAILSRHLEMNAKPGNDKEQRHAQTTMAGEPVDEPKPQGAVCWTITAGETMINHDRQRCYASEKVDRLQLVHSVNLDSLFKFADKRTAQSFYTRSPIMRQR